MGKRSHKRNRQQQKKRRKKNKKNGVDAIASTYGNFDKQMDDMKKQLDKSLDIKIKM